MIWWIFPAAVGLFGLVVFMTAFSRFGKFKLMSGSLRFASGGGILALGGLLAMIGMNLQTYSRLTHERTVAIVHLTETAPQEYIASVRLADQIDPVEYKILGDEIEFKARVIKWTPWANIIGYDAVYRLDRLSGQYTSVEEDLKKPRTVYALHSAEGMDTFELIKRRGGWLKAVDAYYGSGAYVPMASEASYEIIMTQNGLIARALNDEARKRQREWVPPSTDPVAAPVEAD